jgi:hypothetical protein
MPSPNVITLSIVIYSLKTLEVIRDGKESLTVRELPTNGGQLGWSVGSSYEGKGEGKWVRVGVNIG